MNYSIFCPKLKIESVFLAKLSKIIKKKLEPKRNKIIQNYLKIEFYITTKTTHADAWVSV